MALLRGLIVEQQGVRRLYLRILLRLMGIDSVAVRDPRAAIRFASPFAIDLVVCRDRLAVAPNADFQDLVDAGLFGAGVPRVFIADKTDKVGTPRAHATYLPACLRPRDFFRAVSEALDKGGKTFR